MTQALALLAALTGVARLALAQTGMFSCERVDLLRVLLDTPFLPLVSFSHARACASVETVTAPPPPSISPSSFRVTNSAFGTWVGLLAGLLLIAAIVFFFIWYGCVRSSGAKVLVAQESSSLGDVRQELLRIMASSDYAETSASST